MALGTDGPASNNNLRSVRGDAGLPRCMAKLVSRDPEALDARTVLKMATINGAKALGMEGRVGTLTAGALADVTIIDLDRPHLLPLDDAVSHLVYSARGSDVRDVIVGGREVVRNGRAQSPSTWQSFMRKPGSGPLRLEEPFPPVRR